MHGDSKPHHGTKGQSTSMRMGVKNKAGGGAPGQSTSSQNKPCKPHMGSQGQDQAGGVSRGGGPKAKVY